MTDRLDSKHVKVVKEMLNDRKHNIENETKDYILSNNSDTKMLVSKVVHDKISISLIQNVLLECKSFKCSRYIIFYTHSVTPMAKKIIQTSRHLNVTIETMNIKEVSFNITHHYLVPKHDIVKSRDILEELKPQREHLPVLRKMDPVSKYYGYKRGDIVRITRKDKTIMYRIVK